MKIYIIRPKPGPFAKNATPRPSGWESNPRPLEDVADNLGASSVYTVHIFSIYEYIQYIYIFSIYEFSIY